MTLGMPCLQPPTPIRCPVPASAENSGLADRLAAGEETAFDELVAVFTPALARLAARLLGWRMQDAHDALQEVFLAVYRHRRSFRRGSSLNTWLTQITLKQCRAIQRRRALGLRVLEKWFAAQAPPEPSAPVDEVAAEVQSAIRRLPRRDREVIVLYYLEELPVSEVATLLNITADAANVRLHRARQRLAITLAHISEGSGGRHE